MALVQGVELIEMIVESGESVKSRNRSGMAKLLAMVDAGQVKAVIAANGDADDTLAFSKREKGIQAVEKAR